MKIPNFDETVLGTFLHDIGKLLQRAAGSASSLPEQVRRFESDLLPKSPQGYYTHKHALFTEAFFTWMEDERLEFPKDIQRPQVRYVAAFHHTPDNVRRETGAAGWIAAEADRLSSGMDRKERDEEQERTAWDDFIRTPMINPLARPQLPGRSEAPDSFLPLEVLRPGPAIYPRDHPDTAGFQTRYQQLAGEFKDGFRLALRSGNRNLFFDELLSLSERLLWAVPSSTKDEPDVSLHDHSRSAAAIAAALYKFHESREELDKPEAVKDRSIPKFRWIVGDLSGIQHTLFLLAHQQVKGVNRILRARSSLMSLTLEGVAVEIIERLSLSPFSVLQLAGGRFLILAPDIPSVAEKIEDLRCRVDAWMRDRYYGELALNIAVSDAFTPELLARGSFSKARNLAGQAIEEAKATPLRHAITAVLRRPYPNGACHACGLRPGVVKEALQDGPVLFRCQTCDDEYRLGGDLPRARQVTWSRKAGDTRRIELPGGLLLRWHTGYASTRDPEIVASRFLNEPAPPGGAHGGVRFAASYIPRLGPEETRLPRYAWLSEEARSVEAEEAKTFEHLAADALTQENGQLSGAPLLAVLKADVDRLGAIFHSLDGALGAWAGLSRSLDFFFSAQLTHLLQEDFPSMYTVYSGGDDLLLIGPWLQAIRCARKLRERFRAWAGFNPSVTLSCGIELVKPGEPLNRSVKRAENRLEAAKDSGRDRISFIDEIPSSWEDFEADIERAERLVEMVRQGWFGHSFLYRMLALDEARCRAEGVRVKLHSSAREPAPIRLADPSWRARWGYQLKRNVLESKRSPEPARKAEVARYLNELLGLDAALAATRPPARPARTALSIALYQTRKFSNIETTERRM